MSDPADDTKKAIKSLTEALEADLFKTHPLTEEEIKEIRREQSRYCMQKLTLRMLGWQREPFHTEFYKTDIDGKIVDSIMLFHPSPRNSLSMESLDTTMRQVSFNMNKLKLWPNTNKGEK